MYCPSPTCLPAPAYLHLPTCTCFRVQGWYPTRPDVKAALEWDLAHKKQKQPPPRTLQQDYA